MKEACQQNDGGKINKTWKSWSNILGKTYVDHISLGSNKMSKYVYAYICDFFKWCYDVYIIISSMCKRVYSFKFI